MSNTYSYRPPLGLDIRIKPRRSPKEKVQTKSAKCAWAGCDQKGQFRAPGQPQGRNQQWLCLEHVREVNKSWNYFKDMSDDEVKAFMAGNQTGHRPTWKLGGRSAARDWRTVLKGGAARGAQGGIGVDEALGLFGNGAAQRDAPPRRRKVSGRVLAALQTLNLGEQATMTEIKAQYKALVKRYHPDTNGGDTTTIERLRSVIRAYQTLKTSGLARERA